MRSSTPKERMTPSLVWSGEDVQADLGFHHAIAKATGNPIYADFMAILGGVLRATILTARSESKNPDIKAITLDEHFKIIQSIEARDPETAGSAVLLHLHRARQRMTAN